MQLPRFYPILDVASARRRDLDIVSVASQILEGRATILQFRCKKFWTRAIFADLERIAELCRQAGVMLVVNDRADIARMLLASGVPLQSRDREGAVATSPFQSRDREGAVVTSSKSGSSACAVGLHLGQEDLSPHDARLVTGGAAIIGFSTHNEQQVRAAESNGALQPADYLAFGPIFETGSKHNPDPAVGLEGLRKIRPLISRPLVAIGGITRANARSVIDAGADSVAVIGDLFPEDPSSDIGIRKRVEEWLAILSPDS